MALDGCQGDCLPCSDGLRHDEGRPGAKGSASHGPAASAQEGRRKEGYEHSQGS